MKLLDLNGPDGKTVYWHYKAESLADFLNECAGYDPARSWKQDPAADSRDREHCQKSATDSLADSVELARTGWQDGVKKMRRDLDSLQSSVTVPSLAPSYSYDVGGAFPDVAAYCAGDPEHMVVDETDWASMESAVHLVIPGSFPWGMNSRKLMMYGKGLLSVTDALQRSGRSVALSWIKASGASEGHLGERHGLRNPQYIAIETPIAEEGTALDITSVSFAFHPSMLRRLGFAVAELRPELEALGGGMGMSTRMVPECIQQPGKLYPPGPWGADTRGWLSSAADCAQKLHEYIENYI